MTEWNNWIYSDISRRQVDAVYAAVTANHRARTERWVLTDLYALADFGMRTQDGALMIFDKKKESLAKQIVDAVFKDGDLQSLLDEYSQRYRGEAPRRGKALYILGEMKRSELFA